MDLSWIKQVRQIVADEQPDCVISHGFNGHFVSLVVAGGAPVKRLVSYHGSYHPNTMANRIVAPIYNGFTNWFLRFKADEIVSVAQFCVDELVVRGVPRGKFTVVHNGIPDIEVADVSRNLIRKEWGFSDQHTILGIVSRFEAIKGLNFLIDAFSEVASKYESLRLVMIGDGSQRRVLEQQVMTLNLEGKIVFTGMRSDVSDCLSAIDIFALPSLSEAHSIGMLEAMRAGLPIVATGVGGNTESVRHEQEGLIVESANTEQLVEALERLISDADLRKSLAAAARKRFVDEFTEDAMLSKIAAWLKVSCKG